jgi:hypothetical protein
MVDLCLCFWLCRARGFDVDLDRASGIAFCEEIADDGQLIGWQRSWHESISANCALRRNPVFY